MASSLRRCAPPLQSIQNLPHQATSAFYVEDARPRPMASQRRRPESTFGLRGCASLAAPVLARVRPGDSRLAARSWGWVSQRSLWKPWVQAREEDELPLIDESTALPRHRPVRAPLIFHRPHVLSSQSLFQGIGGRPLVCSAFLPPDHGGNGGAGFEDGFGSGGAREWEAADSRDAARLWGARAGQLLHGGSCPAGCR